LGLGAASTVQAVISRGYLGGWRYVVALLVGLAVAGTYARGDHRRDAKRVLAGVALGTALALWHSLWIRDFAAFIVHYGLAVAVVGGALVGTRLLIDRIVALLNGWVRPAERVLFVGDPSDRDTADASAQLLLKERMEFVGWVINDATNGNGNGNGRAALGTAEDFWRVLRDVHVDTVILSGAFDDELFDLIVEASQAAGCRLLAVSRYEGVGRLRPSLVWHHRLPFIELTVPSLRGQQMLVKRAIDVVGAVVGLTILAPVLGVIAALIKRTSPGPVFFSQERVGMGGKVFRLLKFRTMHDGADDEKATLAHLNHTGDPRLFKIPNDPRITPVGAFLRRWSLDELPQLWNVLVGQMSLVGPRPFFEADLATYRDHHFGRLGAKPGITGLWQVRGRSAVVDFEEVVRLDREYIDAWSLWLDLRILLLTVPTVVCRTGAF
jgi:exopolysaccharide biosynthesis polyprenyl glycosylphosphotransferase